MTQELHMPDPAATGDIPALMPRDGGGQQFLCYGDSGSGIPGTPAEARFAAINAMVRRLRPQPEFVCFLGDHIYGDAESCDQLRSMWRYWLDHELAWLDQATTPIYHTTSNHTTYNTESESVWREVFPRLPRNGPPGQEGLSYYVRRGELLVVAVNTCYSGLGDSGHVEHVWLDGVLAEHADATHKLVLGHYPIHPVNGYDHYPVWRITPEEGRAFWAVLARHGVRAYLCSHVLAFDAQVQQGVLQITTGGAGNDWGPGGMMPGSTEYLHAVQAAVDARGLRCQVLDSAGRIREWLSWPPEIPASCEWSAFPSCPADMPSIVGRPTRAVPIVLWNLSGVTPEILPAEDQTLLSGWDYSKGPDILWIGMQGNSPILRVQLVCEPGQGVRTWCGPALRLGQPFDLQIAIHTGMGPGGVMWRADERSPWSSMRSSSARGVEALSWPADWTVGNGRSGNSDRPFRGQRLQVKWKRALLSL